MSVFVMLGLLLCIVATGSGAVTPVFVLKGQDVTLDVKEVDDPENLLFVMWKFNNRRLETFVADEEGFSSAVSSGGFEFPEEKYSVNLKNLQEADSGVYTARGRWTEKVGTLAKYNVIVQDPVSPVELTVDSVSKGSDSCNLTVSCRTQDSHISSTFRCDNQTCSQEGGGGSEVTTSGASLCVYLVNGSVICNHSNHVSWTKNMTKIQDVCGQSLEGVSAGFSVCLVKTVVFSVSLIIMTSAVVCVHIMEKLRKQKQTNGSLQLVAVTHQEMQQCNNCGRK